MLIAAPLTGLICMGIADYSACSIGEARVLRAGKAPWAAGSTEIRVTLTSAVSTSWLDFFQKSAQGPFFEVFAIPVCQASLVQTGRGRSSDVDTWTQSHDFRLPFSSGALSEPCFGDDELTGRCQK